MKILFLDIDSVMTVHDWNKADPPRDQFNMLPFTEECVDALNEIISKTNCKIVLSSDHRNNHSLKTLNDIFIFNGCIDGPIDITPSSKKYKGDNLDDGRAHEISMWLNNNHGDTWVAVDDLMLGSGEFKELMNGHFVETQMGIHLVKEKIISILNSSKGNSFNTNEKE
jgi:hypothetical protein